MHALNSAVVRDQAEREASGTTRKRITRKKLGRVMVPMPPLDEQERLVTLIDNQLDRISSGAEEVRRSGVALKHLEASGIRSALGGGIAGLSDETRRSLVHAHRSPLSNLATIQYGWTAKASLTPIGPRMLRITDIQHGRVDWASVPYCEVAAERRDQYLLRPGDIVFARTGATTGKSYLVQEDVPEAVFASYLIRVRPDERLSPDFLYLYFQGADYWEYVRTESRGTGQPNVNGTILGRLMAPVPSVEAQLEAVRVARRGLEAVAHLEMDLVLAKKQEKVLRQAILSAAVRGGLSPRAENLPHASTEVCL